MLFDNGVNYVHILLYHAIYLIVNIDVHDGNYNS